SIEVVDFTGGQVNGNPQYYPVPTPNVYFDFTYTRQAIYGREDFRYPTGLAPQSAPIWMWPLDQAGNNPVGTTAIDHFGNNQTQFTGTAFAVNPRNTLWVAQDDTFVPIGASTPHVDGTLPAAVSLDGTTGAPTGQSYTCPIRYYQQTLLTAIAADG